MAEYNTPKAKTRKGVYARGYDTTTKEQGTMTKERKNKERIRRNKDLTNIPISDILN